MVGPYLRRGAGWPPVAPHTTTAEVLLRANHASAVDAGVFMTDDVKAPGPKTCEPEAPDFEAQIPELLKKGCVQESAQTRCVLDRELKLAWTEGGLKRELQQKSPSADLFQAANG
jgi:hypothetical protein